VPLDDEDRPSRPFPEALRREWLERGWPQELLEMGARVGVSRRDFETWLGLGESGLERARWWLPQQVDLTFGTIRGREATVMDNDRISDLWANAPEDVGEWEVTVERAPNAFAQYKLQEGVSIPVLEENGVLMACVVWAKCHVVVAGKRLTVHCGQGMRVRRECRGKGYGNLVRAVSSAFWHRPTIGQFHYIRTLNKAAFDFFKHTSPSVVANVPEESETPGIPVTVLQYPRRRFEGDASGIRPARRSDVRRCVSLINRTHRGLDLFRPYSAERLELRLDEGFWGKEVPRGILHVYGWQDYFVLEERGRVVACAGLWDRGRDMRERWRHKVTGEERTTTATAVLDFGFESGHEAAMARLIEYLTGETERLERDFLLAALQQLPVVASQLERLEPIAETRGLGWLLWDDETRPMSAEPDPPVRRPYTDLSYW